MINETDGKKMYFDSNFSLGHYKWKNIINSGSLYQVKTDFTGWDYTKDDCSGSIEFILNIRESENNALYNTGITTNDLMSWTGSTAKALYKKGWVCYVKNTDLGVWSECKGATLDDITDKTADIKSKGVKFLQPGDLLLCTGHGEFYVGGGGTDEKYKYKVTYVNPNADTNNDKKKSGISRIEAPPSFKSPNSLKAEGTFAWGSVKDEFPVESSSGQKHYFYYDTVANVFRHCECGNEPEKYIIKRGKQIFYFNSKNEADNAKVEGDIVMSIHSNSSCDFDNRSYIVIWRKK